jgi:hypothetical protein
MYIVLLNGLCLPMQLMQDMRTKIGVSRIVCEPEVLEPKLGLRSC